MSKQGAADEKDEVILANTPGHLGYKQVRSRRTFERLLDASEVVIAQRGFDSATVTEICERAEVSVGAFYRRFESKEGLLQVLHERYTDRMTEAITLALAPERWRGTPLSEIIYQWEWMALKQKKKNQALMRVSAQRTHTSDSFAARERKIHQLTQKQLARLILDHADEFDRADPEDAAETAAYLLVSASHYHLFHPAHSPFEDEALVLHLVSMCRAFLGVKSPDYTEAQPAVGGNDRPAARKRAGGAPPNVTSNPA